MDQSIRFPGVTVVDRVASVSSYDDAECVDNGAYASADAFVVIYDPSSKFYRRPRKNAARAREWRPSVGRGYSRYRQKNAAA
jgi:hypothetical protein